MPWIFSFIFLHFAILASPTEGELASNICSKIDKIVVRYRDYYDVYLGTNLTTGELVKSGKFYQILNDSIRICCSGIKLEYVYEHTTEDDLETLALHHLPVGDNDTRVLTFFFPEFAEYKDLTVYDFEMKFVKLSRSSGQALVMLKPSPKQPVFVFDIFVKSVPIIFFLMALSCTVGILGWIADHWKNPEEFPNPFVRGMFEGFWWSIVTMTTVGYGDKCPRSLPARFLSIVWVLMSAVLLSLFTANATSILSASQQKEDYSKTIGKKIGVLQSKHFDEFHLNMGAQVINYDNIFHLNSALVNGTIDRLLFPDYKDLLLYFARAENKHLNIIYKIAKNYHLQFETGMVLARTPELLSDDIKFFLKCLRTSISKTGKTINENMGYSKIVYPEEESIEDSSALNQDNLILLTYYILAALASLIFFGILWDIWCWHERRKSQSTEVEDIPNRGQENDAAVADTELGEATWF